jgi:hypothetical protein
MNMEIFSRLYDQALIIEERENYTLGALDEVKFAELIVQECVNYAFSDDQERLAMFKHFGIEP